MALPTLDSTVIAALELLVEKPQALPPLPFERPLVVGSGNALETGRIIFKDVPATFASESKYEHALKVYQPDGAILISASGGKHSTQIAHTLTAHGVRTFLFTHTQQAPAAAVLNPGDVFVFPKLSEPYTYNVSTYFGLIAAAEPQDLTQLLRDLRSARAAFPPLGGYRAYTIVVPSQYSLIVPMLRTKLSELFGSHVPARVFAEEDLKHGKTTIYAEDELYIICGGADDTILYPESDRIAVPLVGSGYLGALATTYALIGALQAEKPPYFANNIERYVERASAVFNQHITPIVD
jgi:hypothetical protein